MMGLWVVGAPGMSLKRALEIVGEQGWFSERSTQTRSHLAKIAKLRNFAKSDLIFMVGDRPNGMFGLVSGSLTLSIPRGDGEDYMIHRAATGFWIGDLALFADHNRIVSVQAGEPTVMVHLPAPDLKLLVVRNPSLYADFYTLAYENCRILMQIISNLAIPSSDKRLADRLLLELETRGDEEGWIPASQPELATLAAMSLPTLRRVLQRFAAASLIKQRYGQIQVLDRAALNRVRRD